MRKLLDMALSNAREYSNWLLIGFLIGITPLASKAVSLIFEWLGDTILGAVR